MQQRTIAPWNPSYLVHTFADEFLLCGSDSATLMISDLCVIFYDKWRQIEIILIQREMNLKIPTDHALILVNVGMKDRRSILLCGKYILDNYS